MVGIEDVSKEMNILNERIMYHTEDQEDFYTPESLVSVLEGSVHEVIAKEIALYPFGREFNSRDDILTYDYGLRIRTDLLDKQRYVKGQAVRIPYRIVDLKARDIPWSNNYTLSPTVIIPRDTIILTKSQVEAFGFEEGEYGRSGFKEKVLKIKLGKMGYSEYCKYIETERGFLGVTKKNTNVNRFVNLCQAVLYFTAAKHKNKKKKTN